MLVAFVGVLGVAAIALKQAISAGAAEAWMMAGVLSVVVALPLALFLLPVISWLQRRARKIAIVPNAGQNVPGVGR
ncbi:hypothetical protein [Lysobacter solisilvae (ex Woo and Kim 2020)]|uniref:DUF2798 domain-containing protein n=1 Tax=Agrilutibacter terrestris TaxID=2865112 RepID=A0A7H0FYF5_9GAMM|nr:hypothetical protein [Lysobacter terrestris]QNP41071.1 hypothetical protein H8B22_02235 [Lysobacter terrestris]